MAGCALQPESFKQEMCQHPASRTNPALTSALDEAAGVAAVG